MQKQTLSSTGFRASWADGQYAGLPWWLSGKESTCQSLPIAGRMGLIPGSGRSLWRRKWQPTRVFLPRRSHGQRSLLGYSPSVAKSHTQMSRHTISTPFPSLVISLDFLAIRFVASVWQLTLLDELFDDFETIGLVICLCRRLGMRAGWIFIDHPHLCFPECRG